MRITEQKVYRRGTARIFKIYKASRKNRSCNRLLTILVILVALFLLSSALVFLQTMNNLQAEKLPRELPDLNELHFRDLLDSGDSVPADSAAWRAFS